MTDDEKTIYTPLEEDPQKLVLLIARFDEPYPVGEIRGIDPPRLSVQFILAYHKDCERLYRLDTLDSPPDALSNKYIVFLYDGSLAIQQLREKDSDNLPTAQGIPPSRVIPVNTDQYNNIVVRVNHTDMLREISVEELIQAVTELRKLGWREVR